MGLLELPWDRDRTVCRAGLTKDPVSQAMAREKGTAQEYIAAYDADPMTHCETCRKKAVWYDREKERFLAEETERLQPKSWQRSKWTGKNARWVKLYCLKLAPGCRGRGELVALHLLRAVNASGVSDGR